MVLFDSGSEPTSPEATMLADVEAAIVRLMNARMGERDHVGQWVVFSGALGAPLSVPLKFTVAGGYASNAQRCDLREATRFDPLTAGHVANGVRGAACSVADAYELILRDYVAVQSYLRAAIAKKTGA